MDQGHIFLDHGSLLNGFAQGRGSLLCPGEDHHAAHVFVQPVDGETFAAQLLHQRCRDFMFRV